MDSASHSPRPNRPSRHEKVCGRPAATIDRSVVAAAVCTALCWLFAQPSGATVDVASDRCSGSPTSTTHPTLVLETDLGPLHILLDPAAAPRAVARLQQLASQPLFGRTTSDPRENLNRIGDERPAGTTYFELQHFDDVRPHRHVTLSWINDPAFRVPIELSAEPLGLERSEVRTAGEAMDLVQFRLLESWRGQGAHASPQLQSWIETFQQHHDASFLIGTTVRQVLEAEGMTFEPGLASRPVGRGSVVLVSDSRREARLQLRFQLTEAAHVALPQVVVGRVPEGSRGIDLLEQIAAQPRLVVSTQRKRDRYRPLDPTPILRSSVQHCPPAP